MNITKIYLVENCYGDPNKVYIGKTKNSRKNNHKLTFGIQIEYNVIDEINSLDRKCWEPLETYWIEQFRQWGFEVMNVRKKGGSGPEFLTKQTKIKIGEGNLGKKKPGVTKHLKGQKSHHKKDTGSKISKSKQGMRLTDEWKSKISKSIKGNKNRLGTTQSQECKNKISKSLKNKKREEWVIKKLRTKRKDTSNMGKHRKGIITSLETLVKQREAAKSRQKPVIQFDKNNNIIHEYSGVREAARCTGCYDSAVTMCCNGKLKSTKGFIFKYKN
jgi:hypothetical protein